MGMKREQWETNQTMRFFELVKGPLNNLKLVRSAHCGEF